MTGPARRCGVSFTQPDAANTNNVLRGPVVICSEICKNLECFSGAVACRVVGCFSELNIRYGPGAARESK